MVFTVVWFPVVVTRCKLGDDGCIFGGGDDDEEEEEESWWSWSSKLNKEMFLRWKLRAMPRATPKPKITKYEKRLGRCIWRFKNNFVIENGGGCCCCCWIVFFIEREILKNECVLIWNGNKCPGLKVYICIWYKRRGFIVSCKLQEPCADCRPCKIFLWGVQYTILCVRIRRLAHNIFGQNYLMKD